MNKEKDNVVDDEPLEEISTEKESVVDKVMKVVKGAPKTLDTPVEPPSEPEPKPLTVKERVPGFRGPVLKLYKRMKHGERLTTKEFAKRLKLTDPDNIQAAGIAWHFMRDEGKIAGEQFYKPPAED